MLLGQEGKRRMRLKRMANKEIFQLYDGELVLHNRSAKRLKEARRLLWHC